MINTLTATYVYIFSVKRCREGVDSLAEGTVLQRREPG